MEIFERVNYSKKGKQSARLAGRMRRVLSRPLQFPFMGKTDRKRRV